MVSIYSASHILLHYHWIATNIYLVMAINIDHPFWSPACPENSFKNRFTLHHAIIRNGDFAPTAHRQLDICPPCPTTTATTMNTTPRGSLRNAISMNINYANNIFQKKEHMVPQLNLFLSQKVLHGIKCRVFFYTVLLIVGYRCPARQATNSVPAAISLSPRPMSTAPSVESARQRWFWCI